MYFTHVLPCVKDCDEWIVRSDCIITNCVYVQTMYLINLRASSMFVFFYIYSMCSEGTEVAAI